MEDEVKEQENEESEQSESNENAGQSEEFNPEIQIPENIDINIDETPSDEIEVSDDTETSEETEQDFSEFDNFVPSPRFNPRATVNPFLEQSIEPVENLERDLRGISNRQTEDNQTQVFNAPQYSKSNPADAYETQKDDTYPKQITSNLPSNDLVPGRMLNPGETATWRNPENSGYPEEEQKYKFGFETRKRRRDDL